tara:strand:- start:10879 stop:12324 length:1446 start_codon:yes stop_codon:yes gene_type:complete
MVGSEPGWEEQDLDRVRTRRKALLSLLEADISLLMNGAGTGSADLKLEQALRLEAASLSKVRLWHFVWSLPKGTRLAGLAAGSEPQFVDAFVLAGPASLARIAGAFRKPDFSASDLYAARQTLGGDDVRRYVGSLGSEAGEVTSRLIECLKTADRREGAICLGMDLAWPNSIGTDQENKLAFTAEIADGNADWSPASLRQNKMLAANKDFVEALIAASVATREDVSTAARRDRERREKEEPLRMLFDGNSVSSEVLSFNSRAEADLVGFSGPVEGEAVVLKVAELPFYKRTRLIDMLDRRSGYPKLASFMGEYSMESNVISYERVLPIDWQSRTIFAKNASETLHLKAETVPSYLKFFCQYIKGSDGYFRIIEDPDELSWLGISKDAYRRAANHIHPIELWTPEAVPDPAGDAARQGQGYYLARGWVIYSRALFAAVFLVSETGAVQMIEDQPFSAQLPIVPETISKKTHFFYLLREEAQA